MARYADDLERKGIPRAEAERQARVEFGSLEPVKEDCRQALGLRLLDETRQDLRYAIRSLRRSPGFAAVCILTLATGIGANTAIFTVVDRWVLRALPYPDPENLVSVMSVDMKGRTGPIAAADFYDLRATAPGFDAICAWTQSSRTLMAGGEPEQVFGMQTSAEFLPMLGVTPQLGRGFVAQDDRPGAPRLSLSSAAVSGEAASAAVPMWSAGAFASDGNAVTIVGVLPAGFPPGPRR